MFGIFNRAIDSIARRLPARPRGVMSALKSSTNELAGSAAIIRDTSEQRLTEELFGLAVETCRSGMLMIDRNGRIVMVNGEIEHLFGYRRDELLGQPVEMLVPLDLRYGHEKLREQFSNRGVVGPVTKGRELSALRKDGSRFFAEIELNSVHNRDGLLVLACIVDVSERRRAQQIRDEFIATVSHELRTPLTAVTASLALLSAGRAGQLSEAAARLVAIAHGNGQRLARLVNDILDIEKYESGKMMFTFDEVNPRTVVEQVIEISRAYADEFGVAMRLDANAEVGSVRADADRLAQVVTNLLSNAIKFSPRGEEVVIAIAEREGTVRISVHDRGAGIPDDFKPHVFERFAQADAGNARKKGGTGLGLSIVKQIVDRLGGEIGFECPDGQGTTFFIEIPRWLSNGDGQMTDADHGNPVVGCRESQTRPDVVQSHTREVA